MLVRNAMDTLRKRALVVFAVFMLFGLTGFVEFAIGEYRDVALEQIEHVAKSELQEFGYTHRATIEAADRSEFERVALDRLRNPDLAFVAVALSNSTDRWYFGDFEDSSAVVFANHARDSARSESQSRLRIRGSRVILETSMSAGSGRLIVGRDVSGLLSGLRETELQVRIFQTGASIVLILGFWVVVRWALTSRDERFAAGAKTSVELSPAGRGASRWEGNRHFDASPSPVSPSPAASPEREATRDDFGDLAPHPALSRAYHVLVVEDNPVNRTVAQGMLERLGCRVTCAEDGLACLELVEEEDFDLVFMDIQMPRMDGLEATRRIRAAEGRQSSTPTPIVALTAHSQPRDRMASHQSGMNDHISKPFSEIELFEALRSHCEPKSDSSRA